jgi:hypothetical protein
VDQRLGFVAQVGLPGYQSYGGGALVSAGGINGTSVGGSIVRVGIGADPLDATKKAWIMRANYGDPDTAGTGSKRSEFTFGSSTFVMGKRYVIGLKTNFTDWSASQDQQVAGFQIHNPDTNSLPNPWLALFVTGGSYTLNLQYSPDINPAHAVNTALLTDPAWTPNAWYKWVIEFAFTDGANGWINVWRNNIQVANYSGPMGAVDGLRTSYLKAGVYHWGGQSGGWSGGGPWDMAVQTRQVLLKGPYVFNDDSISAGFVSSLLDTV